MGEVGGVEGLVEACVFDGCSDDGAAGVGAGGSGDYIDVGRADDEVQGKGWWKCDGEHLALFRRDLDVGEVRGGGGPGAGAVDELFCAEEGGGCLDLDGVAGRASGEDGGVGA